MFHKEMCVAHTFLSMFLSQKLHPSFTLTNSGSNAIGRQIILSASLQNLLSYLSLAWVKFNKQRGGCFIIVQGLASEISESGQKHVSSCSFLNLVHFQFKQMVLIAFANNVEQKWGPKLQPQTSNHILLPSQFYENGKEVIVFRRGSFTNAMAWTFWSLSSSHIPCLVCMQILLSIPH